MKAHPLCRPPRGAHAINNFVFKSLRLGEDGKWRDDNGRPGRAFLGQVGTTISRDSMFSAVAWVATCNCKVYADCPVSAALAKADDLNAQATSVERRRATYEPAPKKRKRKKR